MKRPCSFGSRPVLFSALGVEPAANIIRLFALLALAVFDNAAILCRLKVQDKVRPSLQGIWQFLPTARRALRQQSRGLAFTLLADHHIS
jgi:hypothetical protein